MIDLDLYKRQIGRTTRMLKEASRLSQEGKSVYVLVHSSEFAGFLHAYAHSEKIALNGVFLVLPHKLPDFNWETLTFRDSQPSDVVMIDHYLIETRYGPLLKEWRKYDLSQEQEEEFLSCAADWAIIQRTLRRGGSLEMVVLALCKLVRALQARVEFLEQIAPRRILGRIWRCPDKMVPDWPGKWVWPNQQGEEG